MTLEDPVSWDSDVVLVDGGTAHVRPMRVGDEARVVALYSRLSEESIHSRFLSTTPPLTAQQLRQLNDGDGRRFALVAELGDDVVAVASYFRGAHDEAEVAFTVQDDQQGRGLGTILFEHLAAVARTRGIRRFVATTLMTNERMLRVFDDAGFDVHHSIGQGMVELSFGISPTSSSIEVQQRRERIAEAHSVHRLLTPASIAVIGASRRRETIGNGIVRNLLEGDFQGSVFPVNPVAASIAGVRAYPSIVEIPDTVDLAIICVPAPEVLQVAQECAEKKVGGLVVISAGFAEVDARHGSDEHRLVELARRNGMRLIGPNCMGVVNTNPDVRMNATFAPFAPIPGRVAFASQSGGLGIELLARSGALGLGISTFVSMGNKADVSGNDLLQYWDDDPDTDVVLLYLESFGNPRKFARIARRIARRKPIIAVKSGRTPAGARGTSSHTAALASPDVAVDALFRQAGVIRVDTLEELFDTATVVLHQPLPAGRRVAIVSNGGGPGILAADACAAAGLEVPELSIQTQEQLRSVTSPDAGIRNPVDLVASATAETYRRALSVLAAGDDVDALLVIFVPPLVTQAHDVAAVVTAVAATSAVPVIACFLGRTGTLAHVPLDGEEPHVAPRRFVPTFAFPETAVAALGRAADLAAWRARPEGSVPNLPEVDLSSVAALVTDLLRDHPEGAWLDPVGCRALLEHLCIRAAPTAWAASAAEAVAAAEGIGFPVALKVGSVSIVHKSDVGGVRLGLAGPEAVRAAFDEMHTHLGDAMGGAVVQGMVPPGVETIVGVTRDPSFGSLVLFGMGGLQAELIRDAALRIVPVTDVDAHELVRSLRSSPLMFGYRNTPEVDVAALEDVIVRIGMLAEHVPEIAELDCNPVVVGVDGATVVDLKVRIAPQPPRPPPGVRRLHDA